MMVMMVNDVTVRCPDARKTRNRNNKRSFVINYYLEVFKHCFK